VLALLTNRVVLVDNNIQTLYNYPLKPGMKVQISREKNKHEFRHPMLKILYEDAYLIVVEKKGRSSFCCDRSSEGKDGSAYIE
jgi:23S rRNA pseudouridine1911/1915/1917 synthase